MAEFLFLKQLQTANAETVSNAETTFVNEN